MGGSSRRKVLGRLGLGAVAASVVVAGAGIAPAGATTADLSLTADTPGTNAAVGTEYSYQYVASATDATYSVLGGSLPPGLTLDASTGTLSGLPTAAGSYSFTVEAAGDGSTVDSPATIVVSSPGTMFMLVADSLQEAPSGGGNPRTVLSGFTVTTAGGVGVDAAGNVFVADAASNDVTEVPADGRSAFTFYTSPSDVTVASVAADELGDVYLGTTAGLLEFPVGSTTPSTLVAKVGVVGVSVDPAGNVFFTDGSTVTERHPDGTTVTIGSGFFTDPGGVFVDANDDVFEYDSDGALHEIPASGPDITFAQNTAQLTGIAADSSCLVCVSDATTGNVVEYFQASGVTQSGYAPTTYSATSATPIGLAVEEPVVSYTADSPGEHAVAGTPYSYTFGATPSRTFSVDGTLPAGLNLDPDSGVLSGTPSTPGTSTFYVVATPATGLGSTVAPVTIDVSGVGALFTSTDGVLQQLGPDGSNQGVLTVGGGRDSGRGFGGKNRDASSVAVDPAGDLFVVDDDLEQVIELPADGRPALPVYTDPDGTVESVAVKPDGSVVIGLESADETTGSVVQLAADGSTTSLLDGVIPVGLNTDGAGDVFIADSLTSTVVELHPDFSITKIGSGVLTDPTAAASDVFGDVFVADVASVIEFPAGGGPSFTIASGLGSALDGLVLASDGSLYATATVIYPTATGSVYKITPVAADPGTYSANASGPALDYPDGLAIINPAPPTLNTLAPVPGAVVGQAFSYTFSATTAPGAPAPTFSLVSGSLPAGLSLDPATGIVSGKPTSTDSASFEVEVHDAIGGQTSSTVMITPTDAAPTDVLQYSVNSDRSVPADLAGSTVKGPVFVFAAVPSSDRSVVFSLDGKVFHTEGTYQFDFNGTATATTAYPFDTTTLSDGSHTISAVVTDTKGGVSNASSSFTVANGTTAPPQVLQVSTSANRSGSVNLDGASLSGSAYIFANVPATDRQVMFSLDGSPFHTEGSAPFDFNGTASADGSTAYPFPTATLTDGSHTVGETAVDSTGVATSTSATFTVTNGTSAPPPAMSPLRVSTHPDRSGPVNVNGATLTGTVYVFDQPASPVTSVEFTLDGKNYHFEGTAPYDFNGTADATNALPYMLSQLSKGTHTITAIVTFATGKTQTDSGTFTVS